MTRRLGALMLALLCLVPACSTSRPAGPRAPFHHAVAAVGVKVGRSLVDLAEVIVWRAPKLVLVELPTWLVCELPGEIALALSGRETKVAGLIESLGDEDEEARVRTVTELRELTGLPLEDAEAWRAWWREASRRPADSWAPDFVDACLADLESEDFLVRQEADDRLREVSGRDVGYDAKGSAEERSAGVEFWRAWRAERYGTGGDDR